MMDHRANDDLKALVRTIPDYPKPGIMFRDITTLLLDGPGFAASIARMAASLTTPPDLIAGIEARGFIFGVPVAERLRVPFIPLRKPGKLPGEAATVSYDLEYGQATLEAHRDPSIAGRRVLVVDDVLATGGTAAAAAQLIEALGGVVAGFAFCIELSALGGRARLGGRPVAVLIAF
jgi:adenine phosphoribosyltransferase